MEMVSDGDPLTNLDGAEAEVDHLEVVVLGNLWIITTRAHEIVPAALAHCK